jgi:hypothetical protein
MRGGEAVWRIWTMSMRGYRRPRFRMRKRGGEEEGRPLAPEEARSWHLINDATNDGSSKERPSAAQQIFSSLEMFLFFFFSLLLAPIQFCVAISLICWTDSNMQSRRRKLTSCMPPSPLNTYSTRVYVSISCSNSCNKCTSTCREVSRWFERRHFANRRI